MSFSFTLFIYLIYFFPALSLHKQCYLNSWKMLFGYIVSPWRPHRSKGFFFLKPRVISPPPFSCIMLLIVFLGTISLFSCPSSFVLPYPHFLSILQRTDRLVRLRRWTVQDSNIDGASDLHRLLKLIPNQSNVRSLWPTCPSLSPVSMSLLILCQSSFIIRSNSILPSQVLFQNNQS